MRPLIFIYFLTTLKRAYVSLISCGFKVCGLAFPYRPMYLSPSGSQSSLCKSREVSCSPWVCLSMPWDKLELADVISEPLNHIFQSSWRTGKELTWFPSWKKSMFQVWYSMIGNLHSEHCAVINSSALAFNLRGGGVKLNSLFWVLRKMLVSPQTSGYFRHQKSTGYSSRATSSHETLCIAPETSHVFYTL